MTFRLLNHNPLSGVSTWHAWDADQKRNVIRYDQDVGSILDECKRLANDDDHGWGKGKGWRRIASVPTTIMMQWAREAGMNFMDPEFEIVMRRKIQDPDFKHFRTAPGSAW